MLAILSIIIGIVFVLLLFSMLTSAVVEVYHAAFSSRGKHLRETLEIMLGKEVCNRFYQHSYFRQLSSATKPRSSLKLPIWIEKETFSSVLADVMTPHDSDLTVQQRINLIANKDLRQVLDFLWRQSNEDTTVFRKKVEEWFEDVMARAKDWFGDSTKWRLFFLGLGMTALLNADTLQIYKSLSINAALRDELVKNAETFSAGRDSVAGIDTSRNFQEAKTNYLAIRQTYQQTVESPLGLGWAAPMPGDFWAWVTKLVGWILTGIAVTLGAPFWFDLLRKLLALKGGASTDAGSSSANTRSTPPVKQPVSPFDMKSAGAADNPDHAVG